MPIGAVRTSVLTALLLVPVATAEDWPHWRGPARNSTTPETSHWDEGGWRATNPAWTARVGEGGTSPIIADGRLYTMGWSNHRDTVRCLHAATGKPIWTQSYRARDYARYKQGDEGWYRGVSSTPELDTAAALLYTLGLDGDLRCWDARTGSPRWHVNLYDKYRVPRRPGNRDYGYTSSPLVAGDLLFVEVGASEGTLIAFDKRSGAQRWTSAYKGPAGHNGGPVPFVVQGVPCIALFALHHVVVLRTDRGHEGQTIAQVPWVTDFNNCIASATAWDGHVAVTAGYNQKRIALFDVGLQGITKQREFRGRWSGVCSPTVHEGHIYLAFEQVRCYQIRPDRLTLRWESGRQFSFGPGGSCIVTGEGRLIVWAKDRRGRFRLVLA
ncbi:PQQ-binding-like beta-propeller repeat protein, partial [bacterium]|nr:PQQ-binding-like beta-propeller repeat protein [bacterium]